MLRARIQLNADTGKRLTNKKEEYQNYRDRPSEAEKVNLLVQRSAVLFLFVPVQLKNKNGNITIEYGIGSLKYIWTSRLWLTNIQSQTKYN